MLKGTCTRCKQEKIVIRRASGIFELICKDCLVKDANKIITNQKDWINIIENSNWKPK